MNRACYMCEHYRATMVGKDMKNICLHQVFHGNTKVKDFPQVCGQFEINKRMETCLGISKLTRRLENWKL